MKAWVATERAAGREGERGTVDIFGVLLYFFHNCVSAASFSIWLSVVVWRKG